METTQRITDLTNDSKSIYTAGPNTLLELAKKYNVSTPSLAHAKANPSSSYASLGIQAFGTKSKQQEIQRRLYATIKGQLRELGA